MSEPHNFNTVRLRCPHCKRETFFKVKAPDAADILYFTPPWLRRTHPNLEEPRTEGNSVYLPETNAKCPEGDCGGPVFIAIRWEIHPDYLKYYSNGGYHYTKLFSHCELVSMVPDGRRETLDASIPEQIRTEWDGIMDLAEHRKSPALVIVGCRAVLEAAINKLEEQAGAGGKQGSSRANLQQRIDELAKAGVITHTLRDWAHELRVDGNEGAHELKGDADRALEFARFVEFFLQATFVMEARLKRVQRLPTEAAETAPDPSQVAPSAEAAALVEADA